MMKKKLLTFGGLGLLLYLLSAVGSYYLFANVITGEAGPATTTPAEEGNDYEAITFDQSKPRTETCPVNGAKYSKEQRSWWEEHRPLGIMIENHEDSRPQSGLLFADIVYEAVAEGGITRFLAMYYCQDAGLVGPVRSARTYFLDWVSEYGEYPLYAHVGGANTPGPADALGQIGKYGWNQYNDLNQFSIGYPTFRRDENRLGRAVATEHTMYSTTSRLWEVGKERELTDSDEDGVPWDDEYVELSFKDDAETFGDITDIHVEFWEGYGAYTVDWTFDPEENRYLRNNGGDPHMDRNTNRQLSARNVVVLWMAESAANDGYEGNAHRLYDNIGTGDAIVFQDGEEIEATWSKKSRAARTILTDENGDEIAFNTGLIWFEIVPIGGVVETK